ncbi:hypothetical protein COV82_03285 [Candidatus Peregrinibacteria bacterium CG11_big_fil_rev_8_21_14_0_20_46_8]|nr:MAG: hypothetical protein COV82_03285 [Candidatus Peregrinibacteria bacterium CG11_big_fil_rev_8_21_14_0_20_46_8]
MYVKVKDLIACVEEIFSDETEDLGASAADDNVVSLSRVQKSKEKSEIPPDIQELIASVRGDIFVEGMRQVCNLDRDPDRINGRFLHEDMDFIFKAFDDCLRAILDEVEPEQRAREAQRLGPLMFYLRTRIHRLFTDALQ